MTDYRDIFRSILAGYGNFFRNLLRFFLAAIIIALTAAIIAFPLWFLAIQHTALYSRLLIVCTLAWLAYRSVRRKHLPVLLLRTLHTGGILLAVYAAVAAFIYGAVLPGILSAALGLLLFGLLIRRKPERA